MQGEERFDDVACTSQTFGRRSFVTVARSDVFNVLVSLEPNKEVVAAVSESLVCPVPLKHTVTL